MTQNLDILYNVTGQSLVFDAPEGRPSSVTSSQVFEATDGDDDTAETATTGSPAVETNPNTTFDEASGDGQTDPRKCNIAATTGIVVGREYLATNATGETEWLEVREIADGDHVIARNPLKNAFAAADAFESTRISHAIDSTWVATEENISDANCPNPRYRWQLVYVVDGVTRRHAVFFDLVRYSGTYTVKPTDVDRVLPGWIDMLPTYHREDRGEGLIAEAYRSLKLDMAQAGKADQMARNREVVDDLVLHKAIVGGLEAKIMAGGQVDPFVYELALKRYQVRYDNFVVQPRLPFDDGSEGASGDARRAPIWRR